MIIENLKYYDSDVNSKIIEALEDVSEVILIPEAQVNYYYYDMMNYYEDSYASYAATLQVYYGIKDFAGFLSYMGITEESTMDSAKIYALEDVLLISCAQQMEIELTEEQYNEGVKKYVTDWGYASADELLKDYGEVYLRQSMVKEKCIEALRELAEITTDYDEYKHLLEELENETTAGEGSEGTTAPADNTTAAS